MIQWINDQRLGGLRYCVTILLRKGIRKREKAILDNRLRVDMGELTEYYVVGCIELFAVCVFVSVDIPLKYV